MLQFRVNARLDFNIAQTFCLKDQKRLINMEKNKVK